MGTKIGEALFERVDGAGKRLRTEHNGKLNPANLVTELAKIGRMSRGRKMRNMFSIKPPIEPLRPMGGTGSKRHRGLPNVVVLRQAPVDRMPEEDFASCARNAKRSSTCRRTSSSPSSYKGKKRRRARREHYWSKKQIIQPQNLLIDSFSFYDLSSPGTTGTRQTENRGVITGCEVLAVFSPTVLEGRRGNICLIPENKN